MTSTFKRFDQIDADFFRRVILGEDTETNEDPVQADTTRPMGLMTPETGVRSPSINDLGERDPSQRIDPNLRSTSDSILTRAASALGSFSTDRQQVADAIVPRQEDPQPIDLSEWESLPPIEETLNLGRSAAIDAQLQAMNRDAVGIRESLRPAAPASTEEVVTEDGQPVEASSEDIEVTPRRSGDPRDITSSGSSISITLGMPIFEDGTFSRPLLNNAVAKAITDPLMRSLFLGTMQKEVQNEGPITEFYYNNPAQISAEGFHSPAWRERLRRDGVFDENNNPTALYSGPNVFNSVYANRGGNGDFASGDGDRFRGRGLIQLTGRTNYQNVTNRLRQNGVVDENGNPINLIQNPDLVNDPRYALPVAMAYLQEAGLEDINFEEFGPGKLNRIVNPGAPRSISEERWGYIVDNAQNSIASEQAEMLELNNEYAAQEAAYQEGVALYGVYNKDTNKNGFRVDGNIGPQSRAAMRAYLENNNIDIPEDASDYDLVRLVNRNS